MYAVNKAKMMDPEFCSYYYSMFAHDTDIREEGIEQGIEIGLQQGAHDKAVETARTAIDMGMAQDAICKLTGLSLEDIEELKNI